MPNPINEREDHLCLKEPSGWFVAGASFRRALLMLSDGAFKLFAHLCLEADRRTGRFETGHADLAKVIGKSRRIVGKYIEELEHKEVCAVRSGRNQYARTSFEICDDYWPYRRTQEAPVINGQACNAYVDAIRSSFVAIGCTSGKLSLRDVQFAKDLQHSGIPLELVQDALLMGAVRKYVSWLNGGSPQPIGNLAYFAALISEIQERPLAPEYREYLRRKVGQLARAWAKESAKVMKNRGCLDMPSPEIIQ
jgi:biotin operon repressor